MAETIVIRRSSGDERIPQELIERVLDFADVKDLKTCTLLCKALQPYSSSLYFRNLTLHYAWAVTGFLPAMYASPRLTACVASITRLSLNPTYLVWTVECSATKAFAALKELILAAPRLQLLYLSRDEDDMGMPTRGPHEIAPLPHGFQTVVMENTRLFLVDWALQMFPSVDELVIRDDPHLWEMGTLPRTCWTQCTRLHRIKCLEMHWSYKMPAVMATLPSIMEPDALEKIVLRASGREPDGERYMTDHLDLLLEPFAETLGELAVYDVGYVINPQRFYFAPPCLEETTVFSTYTALHTLTIGATCAPYRPADPHNPQILLHMPEVPPPTSNTAPPFPASDQSTDTSERIVQSSEPMPTWTPTLTLLTLCPPRIRRLHLSLLCLTPPRDDALELVLLCVEAFDWARLDELLVRYEVLESLTISLRYGLPTARDISFDKCPLVKDAVLARVSSRLQSLIQFI